MIQYLNTARTILITIYDPGTAQETVVIAQRPGPNATWGPPVEMHRERD